MSLTEYNNAQRLGKKQYQDDLARDLSPFLPVLDEILDLDKKVRELKITGDNFSPVIFCGIISTFCNILGNNSVVSLLFFSLDIILLLIYFLRMI